MEIIICLTKEDINTRKFGGHYEIITESGFRINFTEEALEEFLGDVANLKSMPVENTEKNDGV